MPEIEIKYGGVFSQGKAPLLILKIVFAIVFVFDINLSGNEYDREYEYDYDEDPVIEQWYLTGGE